MPDTWTRRERVILMLAAIATFTVASVSLVGSWNTSAKLTSYVQCQAQWNQFLQSSLDARNGAASEATSAMDELVDSVTNAKSREETKAALEKYKMARANQLETQKNHPLPPPPDEVCEL